MDRHSLGFRGQAQLRCNAFAGGAGPLRIHGQAQPRWAFIRRLQGFHDAFMWAFMDRHNLGLHGQAQTRCGAFAGVAGLRLRSLR